MEEWLTTGNDIKFVDEAGNDVSKHHIHDIKFENGKIKEIYVYANLSQQNKIMTHYKNAA